MFQQKIAYTCIIIEVVSSFLYFLGMKNVSKKNILFSCFLLLALQGLIGQEIEKENQTETTALISDQKMLYVRAKVFCNDSEMRLMASVGVGLDHLGEKEANYIVAEFSEWEITQIRQLKLKVEILIPDMTTYYRERNLMLCESEKVAKTTLALPFGFNYGSMAGFLTTAETALELDSMYMEYPNLVTPKVNIGNTIEGRPIWMVKISDNPTIDENEPEALFTGVHHAREVITVTQSIYFMQYLLENYGTDPAITYLLQNRELYFIPIVNSDGYFYNETTDPLGGGMWRKNRRDNGDGTFGIDLNRNYGFQWGFDDLGSEPFTNSERYRGTAPFSEPETQVMRAFCASRQFKTALNTHSYGRLLLYPWGYELNPCPDEALFNLRGGLMTQFNFYTYGQSPAVLYAVNGEANDWMYGEEILKPKIMAMTSETGDMNDGFWPLQNRILPLCEEMLPLLLDNAWFAGEYLLSVPPIGFSSSSAVVNLPVQTINYGQQNANNVSISFVSSSPFVMNSGTALINNLLPAGTKSSIIPISLASTTPQNQVIDGIIRTTFSDGYYMDSLVSFTYTGIPSKIQDEMAFAYSFLYPNPTNGKCFVKLNKAQNEVVYVEISDLQGKVVKHVPLLSEEISLSPLNSGMYFYRFMSDKHIGMQQKLWIE